MQMIPKQSSGREGIKSRSMRAKPSASGSQARRALARLAESDRAEAGISLRLPATSANLGPGFDALALALALYLEVDAAPARDFAILASGRSPEVCAALRNNLLLDTYMQVWTEYAAGEPQPLALTVRNGIPLGMGCGSSAASRLAAVALAVHFAGLRWSRNRVLEEAAALEGHPDNAAACCLGGFVAAGYTSPEVGKPPQVDARPRGVQAVSIAPPTSWHALLVLPGQGLATTASRAVLPAEYGRGSVVHNLQNVALLVAAFAQGDASLLLSATADLLHQPFREGVCALLPRLLPLAGAPGILSVTLSGAGPGVLLLLSSPEVIDDVSSRVRAAVLNPQNPNGGALPLPELLPCAFAREGASLGNIGQTRETLASLFSTSTFSGK
jgi:homoserine kinase